VNKLLVVLLVLAMAPASSLARAQELTDVLADGSYQVLGGATFTASATLPPGWAPLHDEVAFVYDPQFYFFMRGYLTDPQYDRRAEFASFGYVVVAAAGDPGGNYASEPSWISHDGFSAALADGQVDLSYRYSASYVPVYRGYQSFVIYANLEKSAPDSSLTVYDDALRLGAGNYLLTGDGAEQGTSLLLSSTAAAEGDSAIEIRSERASGGTHWKLMLFANGSAAGFDGIDLSGYSRLAFRARASRAVRLQGGFGTGDDSATLPFAPLDLTTEYERFELDLTALDRSDVNTLLWVYLHESLNGDFTGVSVFLDSIELLSDAPTETDHGIVVDSASDGRDGVCAEGARTGRCNLRAAMALAAGRTATIEIEVDSHLGSDVISVPAGSAIHVLGTGAQRALTGPDWGRLFLVESGAALTLENVALSKFSAQDGGAIHNRGELRLHGVLVTGNSSICQSVGAMTSYATCWGGAVSNYGTLFLGGDTRFEGNLTRAVSSTASYTHASATGGAITNAGELIIDGPVSFVANTVDAEARSGIHPSGLAGATASSLGGAIFSSGTLTVRGAGVGHCEFSDNGAISTASTPFPGTTATANSSGGAIAASGTVDIPEGACRFSGNEAEVGPDLHVPSRH
jgi:hypothetical protein